MDIKQKVLETIKTQEMFEKGTHIVLGLSGGPDSVCLFDVLCEIGKTEDYHIHPVHVNHRFRPGDAERDQEYVEEICRNKGLVCHSFVVDCNELAEKEGLTSEEAGRKARYDAFFSVAEKMTAERVAIAVAQNANDQAETILFRMIRGTGIDGLAGIAYKRYEKEIAVVRPLLDVPRSEIEKYCEERNLSPRIDHTNSEAIYARNKIRLELLPMLREKFNPNIIETVNRLGKNAAADKEYISEQARRAFEEMLPHAVSEDSEEDEAEVYTAKLDELHRAVRMRVYNYILAHIGMKENISAGQLEAVEKVRLSQSPSAMCDLTEGFRVYKVYDKVRFCREMSAKHGSYRMSFMSREEYEQRLLPGFDGKTVGIFSVPTEAKESVCIRKRRDGDVIAIAVPNVSGLAGPTIKHKKLQDFFVDAKVPKRLRDEMDLLAYGNRILWVLPSEHFGREDYRKKGRFSAEFKPVTVGGPKQEKIWNKEPDKVTETILVLEIL